MAFLVCGFFSYKKLLKGCLPHPIKYALRHHLIHHNAVPLPLKGKAVKEKRQGYCRFGWLFYFYNPSVFFIKRHLPLHRGGSEMERLFFH